MADNDEEVGEKDEDEEDFLGKNDELCLSCVAMPCVCLLAILDDKIELLQLKLKIKRIEEEKQEADKKVAENAAKNLERAENQLRDESLNKARATEIAKPPQPPPFPPLVQETVKSLKPPEPKALATNIETPVPQSLKQLGEKNSLDEPLSLSLPNLRSLPLPFSPEPSREEDSTSKPFSEQSLFLPPSQKPSRDKTRKPSKSPSLSPMTPFLSLSPHPIPHPTDGEVKYPLPSPSLSREKVPSLVTPTLSLSPHPLPNPTEKEVGQHPPSLSRGKLFCPESPITTPQPFSLKTTKNSRNQLEAQVWVMAFPLPLPESCMDTLWGLKITRCI